MCTQQVDSGLSGPRPPRLSNASHIRLIISRFETKSERAPTQNTATLREINNVNKGETLQRNFAPLKTINEIKSDLNNKLRNITDELCKASDRAKTYRSTNNSVNIRRLSESETDSETDNEDIIVFPKQWNSKCSTNKWTFPQFRCDIASEVVVRVVGDCLQSAGRHIVRCLPPVSPHNLAVVTVITSASVPRMVTNLLIYPSCRLVFGTLYPAYASYKAVRTKNVKEYVKWMMYWIVFALFTCAETITDVFFSWFPFYYEVKILLVIWLLSPATKGSSILYRKFVHPALCRREQEIDEYISKAKDQGYHTVLNLGTKGVNYATNVIMQTAIKNFAIQGRPAFILPSPRQPLASVAGRRDETPEVSFVNQRIYGRDQTDAPIDVSSEEEYIPLIPKIEKDTMATIVYRREEEDVEMEETPIRVSRTKITKKKATSGVTKRPRSTSRKTRKQTADKAKSTIVNSEITVE